ncbi:MAG TPA: sialate O-acetylesterase [Bacteroidales bacterium]|nr:sialate O-acetylesterase [Bacteroidales bacterium]
MKKIAVIVILCSFCFVSSMFANISLPSFFSSNMVLQQNADVLIWGWAIPDEEIKIQIGWDDTVYVTKTLSDSTWQIQIQTPKAGGPYTIRFQGYNSLLLQNILIGEVWICAGGSNMEWSAKMGINNADREIAAANYPEIRMFTVAKQASGVKQKNVQGRWNVCSPQIMANYSAAAYFFARELQKELNVPIGIIQATWPESAAEVWTPYDAIFTNRKIADASLKLKDNKTCTTIPGQLYNGMIAPLAPLKIKGFIWYQGEANVVNARTYDLLMAALIEGWRDAWDEDLPFYFVQIAPYDKYEPETGVLLQNSQRKNIRVMNTAMVITTDITGDVSNIHPPNKQDVGKRLAHLALEHTYAKTNFNVNPPVYRSKKVQGKKLIVYFDNAQGLHSKFKIVEGFEIAGNDGNFYAAQAKIVGTSVELTSKQVPSPVHVRFAWSNTARPLIFNGLDIPLSCFNTKE